jgi:hypothetical protein
MIVYIGVEPQTEDERPSAKKLTEALSSLVIAVGGTVVIMETEDEIPATPSGPAS